MQDILKQLGLASVNDGTWLGDRSLADEAAPLIESINPSDNEVIASVRQTTPEEYEEVLATAQASFDAWRQVPAPVRGEAVRRIANALRKYKDPLGSLVTLEMGKIKAEGDGEVQEMIDIADFAVGLSRMMYGKAVAPARHRRHHLGVQLSRGGLLLERVYRRRLRQREHLETVAEDAVDGRRRAEDRQRGARRHGFAARVFPDQ